MTKSATKTKQKTTVIDQPVQHQVPAVRSVNAEAEGILAMIERVALDPRANISKMQELMAMRKEAKADAAREAYMRAMNAVQAEIQPVVRKAENKHTRSKYAKIEAIDESIRPIYTKHGFSLSFDSEDLPENRVRIICHVMHVDGHQVTHKLAGEMDTKGAKGNENKNEMQGLGSSASYLRRYLTCLIFNVVMRDEDDDGNGAGSKRKEEGDAFTARVAGQANGAELLTNKYADLHKRISSVKTKDARGKLLNNNLSVLKELDEAGREQDVQSLHSLVDAGA